MNAAEVADAIREVMAAHDRYAGWPSADKTQMRCAFIGPILWSLGWRTWMPTECQPNTPPRHHGQLDYVTVNPDGNLVLMVLRDIAFTRSTGP